MPAPSKTKDWRTTRTRGKEADIHVLPIGDLEEHVERRDCWCHPWIVKKRGETAVVSHHSADGRELIERYGVM